MKKYKSQYKTLEEIEKAFANGKLTTKYYEIELKRLDNRDRKNKSNEKKKKIEQQKSLNEVSFIISDTKAAFIVLPSAKNLDFKTFGAKIRNFHVFKDNIKYGIVCQEQHEDTSIHFQAHLQFFDSVEIDGVELNKYLGQNCEIRPAEKLIANFFYNLKEGNFIFLTEETKTIYLPFALSRIEDLKTLLKLIPILLGQKIIDSQKLFELTKNGFSPTYRKEIKHAIREFEEETNKTHIDRCSAVAKILIWLEKKINSWNSVEKPTIHHIRLTRLFYDNKWLGNFENEYELTKQQIEILKNYNEEVEKFIITSLFLNFKEFLTRTKTHKNFGIYTWSDGTDKFKSSFWELFDKLSYHLEKDASNNPFSIQNEEYKDYEFPLVYFDDIDISFYPQSYMKRFISGYQTHIRVLGDKYARNDQTLVAFSSNCSSEESYISALSKNINVKLPDKGYYVRVKEVNVNCGILRKLFFELREFMKENEIPYPHELNEINTIKEEDYSDEVYNLILKEREKHKTKNTKSKPLSNDIAFNIDIPSSPNKHRFRNRDYKTGER